LNTITALLTEFSRSDKGTILLADCAVLAEIYTIAATDAAVIAKDQFFFGRYRFRIVTPSTMERTAFQEDSRANARPIIDRKPLNIEN
jgi:hypothetical protein